jgi:activator of HSP90 ATPase
MKDFKKYFTLTAPAKDVYLALTNPKSLMLWTGDIAEMSEESGSEFSLWNGSIVGKNLEFEKNKKIVQQWYFGEQDEASIVTIKLHPQGETTSVELIHTNIPDKDYEEFCEGWKDNYIAGLTEFFTE